MCLTKYIIALLFHTFVRSAGWRYNCVQFWISDKIGKILQRNKDKNFTSNHIFYYNFMETGFVFSCSIYHILPRWGSPCLLTRWTRERKRSKFWLWCNNNLGCDLVTIAVVILWPRLPYCDNLGCDTMTIPVVKWQSQLWTLLMLKKLQLEVNRSVIVSGYTHFPQRGLNLKSCVLPISLQEPLKHL